MRTRKGGNIFTQVGRRFGLYHGPSTSKLMSNFLEIYGQPYVNVRPILKEWTVEKMIQGKSILLLDSRYEEVFIEMYVKIFHKFIHPFSVIFDFKAKVDKYNSSKTKEDIFLIETLTIYVQKYVKQGKEGQKIPANAYDWLMDWIDYMETFKPSSEIYNLKKAMIGHRSDIDDPKWSSIFLLPKAPVRTGGEPTETSVKDPPIYIAPDPVVFEIFLNIIVFLIKLLVVLLSGGMVNPYG
jgi:hypothetical protein